MSFALIGLWMLALNWLAYKRNQLPRFLSVVGILTGVFNFLIALGFVLHISSLIEIAAGLGGLVFGPLWFVMIGFKLRKSGMQ